MWSVYNQFQAEWMQAEFVGRLNHIELFADLFSHLGDFLASFFEMVGRVPSLLGFLPDYAVTLVGVILSAFIIWVLIKTILSIAVAAVS